MCRQFDNNSYVKYGSKCIPYAATDKYDKAKQEATRNALTVTVLAYTKNNTAKVQGWVDVTY